MSGLAGMGMGQHAQLCVRQCEHLEKTCKNVSNQTYLPVAQTQLHVSKPARLESPSDTSDRCTCMQRLVDELQRPTDTLGCIKIPQNSCRKSNLPGTTLCRTVCE